MSDRLSETIGYIDECCKDLVAIRKLIDAAKEELDHENHNKTEERKEDKEEYTTGGLKANLALLRQRLARTRARLADLSSQD